MMVNPIQSTAIMCTPNNKGNDNRQNGIKFLNKFCLQLWFQSRGIPVQHIDNEIQDL
jgi:hypothetical protein